MQLLHYLRNDVLASCMSLLSVQLCRGKEVGDYLDKFQLWSRCVADGKHVYQGVLPMLRAGVALWV